MKLSSQLIPLVATLCLSGFCLADQTGSETFTVHKMLDTNGTNHVAMTYLLPKGWTTNDQLHWLLGDRTEPMQFNTSATSPDGHSSVVYRNVLHNTYTTGPRGVKGWYVSDHPSEVLIKLFTMAHPDLKFEVVDQQDKPVPPKAKSSAVMHFWAYLSSVNLRYTEDGVPILVKMAFRFGAHDSGTAWSRSQGSVFGEWYGYNLTSIRAPEAEFSKATQIAGVVLSSIRFDPEFYQQYVEVTQMEGKLIQQEGQAGLDAVKREGEALEALRNSYHAMTVDSTARFEQEMAAKDLHTRDVCDYILDRGRFTDGTTQFLVPNGYSYAGEKNGDIVLSNDPDFNRLNGYQDLKKLGPGSN